MQVDVSFTNAKVYNVEKLDVVLGQKFSLITDSTIPLDWFANKDAALAITESDLSADVEATGLGTSIIWIVDSNQVLVKKLTIKIVEAIIEPAKSLNVSAGNPVLKDTATT